MYLKKIPIVVHNGPKKSWQNNLKNNCLEENTGKYITFKIAIENEVKVIDKNGEKVTKNISYILQFIDSARFIASSLSNLVNNLSEGIHKIKRKYRHDVKNVKLAELNISIAIVFLNR